MSNMAFNSDPQVQFEILRLRDLFNIKCVIETGSYQGETTSFLGENFEKVFSVEIDEENFKISTSRCQNLSNTEIFKNSSEIFLERFLSSLENKYEPILFYLDAHWGDYWPIKDELLQISNFCKDNCIIVIDDFFVPNRNFQFDSYKTNVCNFDFVKNELSLCYGEFGYTAFYLNKTQRNLPIRDGTIGGVGKLYAVPDKLIKHLNIDKNLIFFQENGYNYSNL